MKRPSQYALALAALLALAACSSGKDQPPSNYSMSGAMDAVRSAGAPKMDPNRKIQSQDCARPIDMAAGNLRCN